MNIYNAKAGYLLLLPGALHLDSISSINSSLSKMSERDRSLSPQPVEEKNKNKDDASEAILIKNLSRNVGENHLRAIFGCYGDIDKVDVPIYFKCAYFMKIAVVVQLTYTFVFSWTEQRKCNCRIS